MTADEIIGRIRRVLLLDASAFEEVRDDRTFTPVAIGATVLAVLLAAILATQASTLWNFGLTESWVFGTRNTERPIWNIPNRK